MQTQHESVHTRRHQSGAILIVSLVLLVALTLIGLSAMDLSILENIMAANSQQQIVSLSNAENVLRTAEQDVDDIVGDASALSFETANDHYYIAGDVDPSATDWTFTSSGITTGSYIIEYAGARLVPGESGEIASAVAGSSVYLFLVDSHSETGKGAVRNVQSVYVSGSPP